MLRGRYYFNPDTLRFERYIPTFQKILKRIGLYLSLIIVLAAILRMLFPGVLLSPKIESFMDENRILRSEYKKLDEKIAKAEKLLQEVQKRDDKVYRSVFNLAPLSLSVREAGYGGSLIPFGDNTINTNDIEVRKTAVNLEKLSTKAKVQSGFLSDLFVKAKSLKKEIESKPSIQPISPADEYRITSSFGYRWDPFTNIHKMHMGLDMAGEVGIKVYATGDGTVVSANDANSGYGNEIIVNHGFGYMTRYAHLKKINVKPGDSVKRGQFIGLLGNSGRSTGPHLHYEVLYNNKAVNPMFYYYENLNPDEYKEIISLSAK